MSLQRPALSRTWLLWAAGMLVMALTAAFLVESESQRIRDDFLRQAEQEIRFTQQIIEISLDPEHLDRANPLIRSLGAQLHTLSDLRLSTDDGMVLAEYHRNRDNGIRPVTQKHSSSHEFVCGNRVNLVLRAERDLNLLQSELRAELYEHLLPLLFLLMLSALFLRQLGLTERQKEALEHEVAQRRSSQLALSQSEQRLHNILEGADLGYWEYDARRRRYEINEHLLDLLKLKPEAFGGSEQEWWERIHPADRARVEAALEQAISDGTPCRNEFRLRDRDGHWIWVESAGAVVERDPVSQQPVRISGTLQDISRRKSNDFALAQLRSDLENQVRLRTRELAEAKQATEQTSLAKTRFLSHLSHELRTPLNAIIGFSQLMELESDLSEEARSNLAEVLKGGRHLHSLIDDILDLSRIESDRVELQLEPLDLCQQLDEAIGLLLPLAQQYDIRLNRPESSDCEVIADRTRLRQVILNLLSNAIKYNREGGRVDIEIERRDAGRVQFRVRDTGEGLSPEQQAQLFQPFTRLGNSGKREGTGIGLVITRRLVELMGGRIGVDSTPGQGSCFWFELNAGVSDA